MHTTVEIRKFHANLKQCMANFEPEIFIFKGFQTFQAKLTVHYTNETGHGAPISETDFSP